ncbi:hypothetical protein GCM10020369_69370 [Cryptosporangium minutisporangium]|uniref:Uncharacterized protein n=1 Tax=Cryptosporangium minutisporangium TaxID=113569 RepID=A0ABP6T810_9ACTN
MNDETTEHLGHEKGGRPGQPGANVRNGTRAKTVRTPALNAFAIAFGDRFPAAEAY